MTNHNSIVNMKVFTVMLIPNLHGGRPVTVSDSFPSLVHTKVKTSDPVRSRKLSIFGPAQYCGGGPRGNRR